jgi:hypothetical protein
MAKKSVEQINKEFQERTDISDEDKKIVQEIWDRMIEDEKLSMEELQKKYNVLDNYWD